MADAGAVGPSLARLQNRGATVDPAAPTRIGSSTSLTSGVSSESSRRHRRPSRTQRVRGGRKRVIPHINARGEDEGDDLGLASSSDDDAHTPPQEDGAAPGSAVAASPFAAAAGIVVNQLRQTRGVPGPDSFGNSGTMASDSSLGEAGPYLGPTALVPRVVDERLLQTYERNLQNQTDIVRVARERFRERAAIEDRLQKEALREKLTALESNIAEREARRTAVKARIDEIQANKRATARNQERLEEDMDNTERQHHIEMLALKRMELERLQEEAMLLDRAYQRRQAFVEVYNEIASSEQAVYKNALDNALAKASTLDAELAHQQRRSEDLAEFARNVVEGSNEKTERLIDDVLQERRLERQMALKARRDRRQALNAEREELLKAQDAVLRAKSDHERLASKGIDFLIDLEMGELPPKEFILRNMEPAEEPEDNVTIDNVLSAAEETLRNGESRVEMLKEIFGVDGAAAGGSGGGGWGAGWEYRGQWGIDTLPEESQEHWSFVEVIVQEIIDEVLKDDPDAVPSLEALRKEQAVWEEERRLVEEQLRKLSDTNTARIAVRLLIDEVVPEFIEDIWRELEAKDELVAELSHGLLVSTVERLTRSEDHHDIMATTLSEYRKIKEARRPGVYIHTQLLTAPGTVPDISDALGVEDDPDIEELPLALIPEHTAYTEFISREQFYWTFVDILPQSFDPKKGGISATASASNGPYLAVGTTTGALQVWDVSDQPPLLLRTTANSNMRLTDMVWSADGTQLLTIDARLTVRAFSMSSASGTLLKKDSKDYRAGAPVTALEMGRTEFAIPNVHFIPGVYEVDDKTLPSTANFHPSLTLLGTQPSFVVGMEGGDIVKCNTTASRSAVSHKSVIPFERQTVIHERVRVELFKAHNCKVLLVDFVRNSSTMVSVDTRANVFFWDHTADAQSGFGWMNPSTKKRVQLVDYTYTPDEEIRVLFAGERAVSEDPLLLAETTDTSQMIRAKRQAERDILDLALPEKAWHMVAEDDGTNRYVYMPKGADEVADFHVLSFFARKLVMHHTQTHRLVANEGVVLDVKLTHSKADLILMVYFPAVYPKAPYLTFVVMNLDTQELVSPRIDVPLDEPLEGPASFAISRVFDGPGSDYIFAVFNNALHVLSLASGLPVKNPIQIFPEQDMRVITGVEMMGGYHGLVLSCPNVSAVLVYELEDKNVPEEQVAIRRAADTKRLDRSAVEHRVRAVEWTCETEEGRATRYFNRDKEVARIIDNLIDVTLRVAEDIYQDDYVRNIVANRADGSRNFDLSRNFETGAGGGTGDGGGDGGGGLERTNPNMSAFFDAPSEASHGRASRASSVLGAGVGN